MTSNHSISIKFATRPIYIERLKLRKRSATWLFLKCLVLDTALLVGSISNDIEWFLVPRSRIYYTNRRLSASVFIAP